MALFVGWSSESLFGLDELVCQLARPNLQQARGIAMVGAGIIKCRDTIEEFPHLGFARGLADIAKTGFFRARAIRATPAGAFSASVWRSSFPSPVMTMSARSIFARRSIASATTSKPDRTAAPQKVRSPKPRPPAAPAPGTLR